MTMREEKIFTVTIEIQKENCWANHAFSIDN